jgi:adenylosuccinate synthase
LSLCRESSELPPAARALVELIEREAGVPVSFVGVGPDRDDVIKFRP